MIAQPDSKSSAGGRRPAPSLLAYQDGQRFDSRSALRLTGAVQPDMTGMAPS
jgi:hypothetical protein